MTKSVGSITAERNQKYDLPSTSSHEAECLGGESGRAFSVAVRGDPLDREIIMEMNFDRYGGVDLDSSVT